MRGNPDTIKRLGVISFDFTEPILVRLVKFPTSLMINNSFEGDA